MVNYVRNAVSNRYQNVEIVELILFTAVKIAFIYTYQQQAQQQRIALQWNGRMAERKTEHNSAISKELNTRFILILFWFPFIPFLSLYVSANQTQFASDGHAFRSQIYNVCFLACIFLIFFFFISPAKFNSAEFCRYVKNRIFYMCWFCIHTQMRTHRHCIAIQYEHHTKYHLCICKPFHSWMAIKSKPFLLFVLFVWCWAHLSLNYFNFLLDSIMLKGINVCALHIWC